MKCNFFGDKLQKAKLNKRCRTCLKYPILIATKLEKIIIFRKIERGPRMVLFEKGGLKKCFVF
jgi:hypothetical protein